MAMLFFGEFHYYYEDAKLLLNLVLTINTHSCFLIFMILLFKAFYVDNMILQILTEINIC